MQLPGMRRHGGQPHGVIQSRHHHPSHQTCHWRTLTSSITRLLHRKKTSPLGSRTTQLFTDNFGLTAGFGLMAFQGVFSKIYYVD
jgi:hypothetical protein